MSTPYSLSGLIGIGAVAAGLALVSCGDDGLTGGGNAGGNDATGPSSGAGGTAGAGGACFGCTGGGGTSGSLAIVPPMATIDVVDGVAMPVDFNATYAGADVFPSWVVDLSSVAASDGDGLVTATGTLGGLVTLKATYQGATATALVTVNVKKTINPEGFTPAEIDILKNPMGGQDATITWAYPYDKTVFPKGLLAPELMWNGGGAGDKYFVHLKGQYSEFDIFTTADPPARHQLDVGVWVPLTESGQGLVDLKVNRLPVGTMTANNVIDHDWTVASGALRGTVYYWSNNLGRVLRIKPDQGAPEDFLANAGVTGCSTCHSVSANGSKLILGGDVATSTYDLLTDTTVLSLPSVGKPVRNWAMPAVSPDGSTIVENNAPLPGPPGGSDGAFDSTTGLKLTGTGLDGILLDMPAFAPDGSRLAYVDHGSLGLGAYGWDPVAKVASNPISLVPAGADPQLSGICFPSVSPDAEWIVYHRGTYPGSLDTRFGPGSMYLANSTTPGADVRLRNLNGDDYPFAAGDRDRLYNYEPTFAPLEAGGYAWVVFTSRRTYGNRLTGGSGAVKQLWVAAVDADPQDGVDPSHPAFRVPGQDINTLNMRGFWALDPCKQVGDSCTNGSECCNQNCVNGFCEDPPPDECVETGNSCVETADCCDPNATCVNGFCGEPPPQ